MQTSRQLSQQIEECERKLEQDTYAYIRSKNQVKTDAINVKRHLPLLVSIMLGGGFILLVSPRARIALSRFNSKALVALLNIRLGLSVLPVLINVVREGRKLLVKLDKS